MDNSVWLLVFSIISFGLGYSVAKGVLLINLKKYTEKAFALGAEVGLMTAHSEFNQVCARNGISYVDLLNSKGEEQPEQPTETETKAEYGFNLKGKHR